MFPCSLARIITFVNSVFLILVAVPLGVYLLAILFFQGDLGERDSGEEQAAAPLDHAPESMGWVEAEPPITLEQPPAGEIVPSAPSDAPILDESGFVPVAVPVAAQVEAGPVVEQTTPALTSVVASTELLGEPVSSGEATLETEPMPQADAASPAEFTPTAEIQTDSPTIPQAPVAAPAEMDAQSLDSEESEPILPEGPLQLPDKGSPKYAFDYRGRLWVEKRRKSFFRQLRRPQLPPEEPPSTSGR